MNEHGQRAAIMKPCDEEPLAPNNPKGFVGRQLGEPGLKGSVKVSTDSPTLKLLMRLRCTTCQSGPDSLAFLIHRTAAALLDALIELPVVCDSCGVGGGGGVRCAE
eukprot:scaffold220626_cov35-Prasinocladus_malaysianus.AAC.1